ncbi:MAG: TfoX/Sxy family protein [Proteobacteria bacterium]|nr:TfoX/Sxy family protein [Pseudomonadota bacterium]
MKEKSEDLPNMGKKLAERLKAIGIDSCSRLQQVGSVEAEFIA